MLAEIVRAVSVQGTSSVGGFVNLKGVTNFSGAATLWLWGMEIVAEAYQTNKEAGTLDYLSVMTEVGNITLERAEGLYENLDHAVTGSDGRDGSDGISTIQVFNVAFEGDGSLEIIGGNGTNGSDATGSAIGTGGFVARDGGDGGNGGHAIFCSSYMNLMDKGKYTFLSGVPGSGGEGKSSIGGSVGSDGTDGSYVSAVQTYRSSYQK